MTGVQTFTDDQLVDEIAFARMEKRVGGRLGHRIRVTERIKALECEQIRRMWEAS